MKITRLETFFVKPRFIFLKIHTDEGICGWGEPTLEGRIQTIAATIGEYEKYLIGQDPTRVEHLWQTLYRSDFYRGGPIACSAISGIEQALWDITGKAYGQPVYKLLGGAVRDKIRMYSGCSNDPEMAKEKVARGFTALKAAPDGPALP
ncbi:MAG: galactonate dehydratase, partial [Lentisphaeria bacterium]|nr:galactonate dehydratase [Lentisphaeria bacterium]NQZ69751.1 galactonate dehydratase [Lentisphaeria bacterium]